MLKGDSKMKTYYSVTSSCDDRGNVRASITGNVEANERPMNTYKETRRKDIYVDWFDTIEEARDFVKESKTA
jgi:hypothetical protein